MAIHTRWYSVLSLSFSLCACGERPTFVGADSLNANGEADRPRVTYSDEPAQIELTADVEVETWIPESGGTPVQVQYGLTAQLDTADGAAISLAFPANATEAQNPLFPASLLVSASANSFTGAEAIVTGAGTIPAGGEAMPVGMESSMRVAYVADTSQVPSVVPAQGERILAMSGDLVERDLKRVKSSLLSREAGENPSDRRRRIDGVNPGDVLRSVIERKGETDSLWIDRTSMLVVREVLRMRNGERFEARYAYDRVKTGHLVRTLTETQLSAPEAPNIHTVTRLSNVQIR